MKLQSEKKLKELIKEQMANGERAPAAIAKKINKTPSNVARAMREMGYRTRKKSKLKPVRIAIVELHNGQYTDEVWAESIRKAAKIYAEKTGLSHHTMKRYILKARSEGEGSVIYEQDDGTFILYAGER